MNEIKILFKEKQILIISKFLTNVKTTSILLFNLPNHLYKTHFYLIVFSSF